jgi:hypothetical protein
MRDPYRLNPRTEPEDRLSAWDAIPVADADSRGDAPGTQMKNELRPGFLSAYETAQAKNWVSDAGVSDTADASKMHRGARRWSSLKEGA